MRVRVGSATPSNVSANASVRGQSGRTSPASELKRKASESVGEDSDSAKRTRNAASAHSAHSAAQSGSSKPLPLRKVLTTLITQFVKIDKHGIFYFPVKREAVPDYFAIIKQPMDFTTMKSKISLDQYPDLASFRADFELICSNAMLYNKPETIYHQEAQRLLDEGEALIVKYENRVGTIQPKNPKTPKSQPKSHQYISPVASASAVSTPVAASNASNAQSHESKSVTPIHASNASSNAHSNAHAQLAATPKSVGATYAPAHATPTQALPNARPANNPTMRYGLYQASTPTGASAPLSGAAQAASAAQQAASAASPMPNPTIYPNHIQNNIGANAAITPSVAPVASIAPTQVFGEFNAAEIFPELNLEHYLNSFVRWSSSFSGIAAKFANEHLKRAANSKSLLGIQFVQVPRSLLDQVKHVQSDAKAVWGITQEEKDSLASLSEFGFDMSFLSEYDAAKDPAAAADLPGGVCVQRLLDQNFVILNQLRNVSGPDRPVGSVASDEERRLALLLNRSLASLASRISATDNGKNVQIARTAFS